MCLKYYILLLPTPKCVWLTLGLSFEYQITTSKITMFVKYMYTYIKVYKYIYDDFTYIGTTIVHSLDCLSTKIDGNSQFFLHFSQFWWDFKISITNLQDGLRNTLLDMNVINCILIFASLFFYDTFSIL